MSQSSKSTKTQQTLNKILDAALDAYQRKGIASTNLDEVARVAKIGRTTLYRYVANRDDLLNQVLQRDAEEVNEELKVLLRYHDNLGAAIVDTFIHNVRGRKARPINKLLFGDERHLLIDRIVLNPENFLNTAKENLTLHFEVEQKKGNIREGVSLDMIAELLTRLTISYFNDLGETGRDEKKLRDILELMVVPSILKSPDER